MASTTITGTVKKVVTDRGFGFIKIGGGEPDVFFHHKALAPGMTFDERLEGTEVKLTTEASDRGPRASKVWAD
jgi:cold shock protein